MAYLEPQEFAHLHATQSDRPRLDSDAGSMHLQRVEKHLEVGGLGVRRFGFARLRDLLHIPRPAIIQRWFPDQRPGEGSYLAKGSGLFNFKRTRHKGIHCECLQPSVCLSEIRERISDATLAPDSSYFDIYLSSLLANRRSGFHSLREQLSCGKSIAFRLLPLRSGLEATVAHSSSKVLLPLSAISSKGCCLVLIVWVFSLSLLFVVVDVLFFSTILLLLYHAYCSH